MMPTALRWEYSTKLPEKHLSKFGVVYPDRLKFAWEWKPGKVRLQDLD
jgi:hypothetical protein